MKQLLLLVTVSFFCFCCTHSNEDIKTLKVDVDTSLSDGKVSIYDIFSKVDLIALDDTFPISNSVHTGEAYITYDGNNFYILDDKSYKVNVYNKEGRILYQANKVGRGVGEYTMAYQIEYNSNTAQIEILNPMGKILRFDKDSLKYVSELNFIGNPLSTHNFNYLGDDYILYSAREADKLYKFESETHEVLSYSYQPPEYLRKYISPQSPFLYLTDSPCIFRPYDGLIYKFDITNNEMQPFIQWDFGKYQCRLQDIPHDKSNREYYDFILEYSKKHIAAFFNIKCAHNIIYASVILKGETYTLLYDLNRDYSFLFKETSEGMKFLPELFHDNIMYKYVDSASLPDFINRNILDSQSQAEYDKVICEEGAAIIKYTLK